MPPGSSIWQTTARPAGAAAALNCQRCNLGCEESGAFLAPEHLTPLTLLLFIFTPVPKEKSLYGTDQELGRLSTSRSPVK